MLKKKSNLDEMQEQKLLRIEHNGCWLAFWGLLAAMVAEQVIYGMDFSKIAGEWIVFMALALYLGVDCARNGIWDRRLQNNWKTNLIVSLAAGAAVGGFMFAATYARYFKAYGSLAAGAIAGAVTFALCFPALSLAGRYTKKRRETLEAEPEDEVGSEDGPGA